MVDNSPGPGRTLAAGALSTRDVVVMALASSGSTQSVAVSLAAILATVAYAAKFQWLWAIFEYLLILGFCVAALVGIYDGTLHHAGNILAFVGEKIGGGFWKNVMIVAVLGVILSSRLVSSRAGKAAFYSDPSVSHGDTVEAELAAASGPTAGPEAD